MKKWSIEIHPDWYKDIPIMHSLILGSFPPHPAKRIYPFYYPNARNRFWQILAELAGIKLQWTKIDPAKAVLERFEIMKKLKVGVQNMGFEIERLGTSALDNDIKINKFHDIRKIAEKHPELRKILLPGYSAKSSTTQSFIRYLSDKNIEVDIAEKIKPGLKFEIQLGDRLIDCVILNSTSTACRVNYESLLDQFRKNIL